MKEAWETCFIRVLIQLLALNLHVRDHGGEVLTLNWTETPTMNSAGVAKASGHIALPGWSRTFALLGLTSLLFDNVKNPKVSLCYQVAVGGNRALHYRSRVVCRDKYVHARVWFCERTSCWKNSQRPLCASGFNAETGSRWRSTNLHKNCFVVIAVRT